MSKKLIKDLYSFTLNDVEDLTDCLNERMMFEQSREPESDGKVHDDWDERVDELQEIIDQLEECETEEDFEDIISAIGCYQDIYGGLSRLKVG